MLEARKLPPGLSTKSRCTTTFLSGSIDQSNVRKCSIFVGPMPSDTLAPPLVQPISRSSRTLNATRRYILIPVSWWIPSSSSFSSRLCTWRRKRWARLWNTWIDMFGCKSATISSNRIGSAASSSLKSRTTCLYRSGGGKERSITYFGGWRSGIRLWSWIMSTAWIGAAIFSRCPNPADSMVTTYSLFTACAWIEMHGLWWSLLRIGPFIRTPASFLVKNNVTNDSNLTHRWWFIFHLCESQT